jgi:hypothetical protein
MMGWSEPFAQKILRKALEEKLSEWIGVIATKAIEWIDMASSTDIARVANEMPPGTAEKFRRMCVAVKGAP